MRDSDDLPYIVIERHTTSGSAFIWGALLGAGAALLFAPRSGAQTQEEIRAGVQRVRTAAEERVDAARATAERTRDRIEDEIGDVRNRIVSVRDEIDARADRARDTFEEGRRAAREARDDLQRRVSEAKESYGSRLERAGRGEPVDEEIEIDVVFTEAPEEDDDRLDIG